MFSNSFHFWIDKSHMDSNTNSLANKYVHDHISEFMSMSQRKPEATTCKLKCRYYICKNNRNIIKRNVWNHLYDHLYSKRFMSDYKIGYLHKKWSDYSSSNKWENQTHIHNHAPYKRIGRSKTNDKPKTIRTFNFQTGKLSNPRAYS